MEENFIYDDLAPQEDLGTIITDLQTRNAELQHHVASLEDDIKKLCDRITEMKSIQDNLTKNISELFNTAKAELDRKDRRIKELQSRLDDMIFKRGQASSNSGFKRKLEHQDIVKSNKIPKCETIGAPQISNADDMCSTSGGRSGIGVKEEDVCKSRTERLNQDSVLTDYTRQESDHMRKTHTRDNYRDNNHARDNYSNYYNNMRERRNRRDNFRDHDRDWNNQRDRTDNREIKMGQRESLRESRYSNRGYFNRGRGPRSKSRDYRDVSREHRESYGENYREHRENHREQHPDNRRENSNVPFENRERASEYKKEIRQHGQHENDKCDDIKYGQDNCKQDNWHSEVKPEFSEAESTSTLFDTTEFSENPKEEGELSDEASQNVLSRKKDFGKDVPVSIKKKFSVDEYIQKQKSLKKNVKKIKTNDNQENKINDSTNYKRETETIIRKTEIIAEKRKQSCGVEKKDASNGEIQSISKNIKFEETKNKNSECDKEEKSSAINIISQIIINEEVKDKQTAASASQSQPEQKSKSQPKTQESKKNPEIVGTKTVEKKKMESGVPRNLTDELNINMESLRKREKLMTELFGSSEKKVDSRSSHQFSPSYGITLSHDGEIPKIKLFSSPCTADRSENSLSSEEIMAENPVTKFQIFKTNLPQLEKSNSLSTFSVQFQTPDKTENISPLKQKEYKICLSKSVSEQYKDQSTSDICNMNLDMLNMEIGQCKAEDFPNLTADSDSKETFILLSASSEKREKNAQKKPRNDTGIGKSKNNINENKKISEAGISKISSKSTKTGNKKGNSSSSIDGQIKILSDVNISKEGKNNPLQKEGTSKHPEVEKKAQPISEELDSKQCLLLTQKDTVNEKTCNKSSLVPNSDKKSDKESPMNPSSSRDISDLLLTPMKENIQTVSRKSTTVSKTGRSDSKIKSVNSTSKLSQVSPEKGKKKTDSLSNITPQINTTGNLSNEKSKLLSEEAKASSMQKESTKDSSNSEVIQVIEKQQIQKASQSSSKSSCNSEPIDIKTKTVPNKSTSTVRTRKHANKKAATEENTLNTSKNLPETNTDKSNSLKNIPEQSSKSVNAISGEEEIKISQRKVKQKKSPIEKIEDTSKQKEISTKQHEESAQSQFPTQIVVGADHIRQSSSDTCNPGLDLPNTNPGFHESEKKRPEEMPDLLSKPIDENEEIITKKTINSNVTNKSASFKNADEESMNVTIPNSSGKVVKESKDDSNVNKELKAQAVPTNGSTETKTGPNIRRRRCVVKWV